MKKMYLFLITILTCAILSSCGQSAQTDVSTKTKTGEQTQEEKYIEENTNNTYLIEECYRFNNGIAWVKLNNIYGNPSDYRCVIINSEGNIINKFTSQDLSGLDNRELFEKAKFINKELPPYNIIINSDSGKISATPESHNFKNIAACGDGYYMVYNEIKNIDENKCMIGIINDLGEWIMPLSDIPGHEFTTRPNLYYLGDGVFGVILFTDANRGCSMMLYDIKTSQWSKTIRTERPFTFNDGYAIAGDGRTGFVVDTHGNIKFNVPFYSGKYSDKLWYSHDAGAFYDANNNMVLDISKYKDKIHTSSSPRFENGYSLLRLVGKDGNYYFTVIDKSGNQLFEPKSYKNICDSISCQRIVTDMGIMDLNGSLIETKATNFEIGEYERFEGYYNGFMRCNNKTNYVDTSGNLLFANNEVIVE